MQSKHYVLGYRTDLYFHDYKLEIEIYEFGYCDRDIEYEKEREERLKEELNCVLIRTNPHKENTNCFKAISDIPRHINKSTRELIKNETKDSIIEDVKKLLKSESKFSNNGTISKFRSNFARHILLTL